MFKCENKYCYLNRCYILYVSVILCLLNLHFINTSSPRLQQSTRKSSNVKINVCVLTYKTNLFSKRMSFIRVSLANVPNLKSTGSTHAVCGLGSTHLQLNTIFFQSKFCTVFFIFPDYVSASLRLLKLPPLLGKLSTWRRMAMCFLLQTRKMESGVFWVVFTFSPFL